MDKSSSPVICCAFLLLMLASDLHAATTVSSNVDTSKSTTSSPASTLASLATTSSTPTTSLIAPPVPDPLPGTWSTNGSEIILHMAAQIDIMYNTTNQTNTTKINVPADNSTVVSANIGNSTESITLAWKSVDPSANNSLTLHFKKYLEINSYALNLIQVSIDKSELPNQNSTLNLVHAVEHFNTTIKHSYRCAKLPNMNLTESNDSSKIVGILKVSNFRMQAFKDDHTSNFGYAEDCAMDVSDVVPIAVGCVLAALVVIVLIAYLISRQRSQVRGYLSM